VVGKLVRGEVIPRRLKPIFRDRDELAAGTDLGQRFRDALEVSRHLIVVCFPHSRRSEYVGREIQSFKQLGRSNRIIAYIIEGEPADCFREELRYEVDECGQMPAMTFPF
jgi:eukaryotic-like serine/threonine-protein kinase